MKSILFIIFIIISFSAILSKTLRISDIIKRSILHPHSTTKRSTKVKTEVPMTRGGPATLPNSHATPNSQPFSKRNNIKH